MATISLDAVKVFQVVAEAGSFTRAGERLGQNKSQVSRTVRTLEAAMRVELLARTTRSVRPTAEGEQLLRRVTPLLAGLHEAVDAVPARPEIPVGQVVVSTTVDLARAVLAPALVGFRLRFPGVRVTVVLSHQLVGLAQAGVDLAVRVGRPGGEALVARKVGELAAGFHAAPAYLERRGVPRRMADLAAHEGLWPEAPRGQRAFATDTWSAAAVQCADFGFLAELARAGGGVALLPTFLAERDVASGALVRVLPDVSLGQAPVFLVSRAVRPLPPRVQALRGHLLESLPRVFRGS